MKRGKPASKTTVKMLKNGSLEDFDGRQMKEISGILCGFWCDEKEGNYGPYRMWKFEFVVPTDRVGFSKGDVLSLSVLKDYVAHGIINMLLNIYAPNCVGLKPEEWDHKADAELLKSDVSLHFSLTDKGFVASSIIMDGKRTGWKHNNESLMSGYVSSGGDMGNKNAVNDYKNLMFREFGKYLNDIVASNWDLVNVVSEQPGDEASGENGESAGKQFPDDDIPF